MNASVVTTTVSADPDDAPELHVPPVPEDAFTRPSVRVGGGVRVSVRFSADHAAAAEWWRSVAATAELAAAWHDARGGAFCSGR